MRQDICKLVAFSSGSAPHCLCGHPLLPISCGRCVADQSNPCTCDSFVMTFPTPRGYTMITPPPNDTQLALKHHSPLSPCGLQERVLSSRIENSGSHVRATLFLFSVFRHQNVGKPLRGRAHTSISLITGRLLHRAATSSPREYYPTPRLMTNPRVIHCTSDLGEAEMESKEG
jgi:hypothetical protein